MRDYSELRAAANGAGVLSVIEVHVGAATILALLDELDALRAASKPAKPKRNDYPPAFDEVWAAYPVERQGTKRTAFKAWSANVKRGVEPAEMALGLSRYLAHAEAIGTETRYLKLAATFFGPDEHFAAAYVMPQAQRQQLGKAGQATARAAQDWMGES